MKTKSKKKTVKAVKKPSERERSSPCASSKCRHLWCLGYQAGYIDGQEDQRLG
jgi:hypothetical protein